MRQPVNCGGLLRSEIKKAGIIQPEFSSVSVMIPACHSRNITGKSVCAACNNAFIVCLLPAPEEYLTSPA